jgi:hypothetical protein
MSGEKPTKPVKDKFERAMDALLEGNYWPQSLKVNEPYVRVQDDCDGDLSQVISVQFTQDADAWVATMSYRTLRFRHEFGGGRSPRVRNALLVLAEAIRRDNEERPDGPRTWPG